MQARRMAGIEAASRKYDLLTALGCHALGQDRARQRTVLRLVTLITARFNWQLGTFSVGQREIARLWAVDERTVKREMAKLRALGWLVLETPARRGRVASYALDLPAILEATRSDWSRVGPDFAERMTGTAPQDALPSGTNVLPFPGPEQATDEPRTGASEWGRACERLRQEMPAAFDTWFRELLREGRADGCLILRAPSAFHATYVRAKHGPAIEAAVRLSDTSVLGVRIID